MADLQGFGLWIALAGAGALLLVAAAIGLAWALRRTAAAIPDPSPTPTEADMRRELALSLAVMLGDGEPPANGPPAGDPTDLAMAARFAELSAVARKWKAEGGKARNPGAFNDLLRALEAIADEPA